MGYVNADLIRQLATAIQTGKSVEKARIVKLLSSSQASCPHKPKDRRVEKIPQDSPMGRYKKGGTLDYCKRCSGIVRYYPPGVVVLLYRPTAWEALLGEDQV